MTVMLLEWVFTSTFLILVVLGLRAALGKRMSAGLRYALWAVVLARLLVPVQLFTSPIAGTWVFTESPTKQTVTRWPVTDDAHVPAGPDDALSLDGPTVNAVNASKVPTPPAVPSAPEPPVAPDLTKAPAWLGWAWLAGAVTVAAALLLSNLRFFRRLRRERIPLDEADHPLRVYVAAGLPSPCLFGIFRPAIYVTPEAAGKKNPDMLRHVLTHEYTHYKHGDQFWSLLRCAALAAHWWNPLVWLAARLSQRDGELACDEGALKRLGDGERAKYGSTLLALVTAKPRPGDLFRCATTMAGDKKSLEERISRIAKAPKRVLWAVVVAVLVTALACVCAFGQRAEAERDPVSSADPTVSDQPSQEPGTYDEYEWIMSHFVPDVADVPEDVLRFVGKAVQEKYAEYLNNVKKLDVVVEFDDWRVDSLSGPWHGTACGMDLEVWRMNYSFHTTTPEAAENLIVAANEFVEENWLRPTYPNSNYVIFQVNEGGKLGCLTSVMINDCGPDNSPEMFYEKVGKELEQQGLTDPAALTDVDLNRNGVAETLKLVQTDDGMGQRLEVREGNELIFSEEGYYAHAGWNALFLYRDGDGQDYLLRYNPYMGQGWCTYRYELFTLSETGEEQVKRGGSVDFDVNFNSLMHESFDPKAIAAFMDEVNGLLARSVQLLNTDQDLLDTFQREGRLYDSLSWLDLDFTRDPAKSLPENLRNFKAAMEKEQEDPWGLTLTASDVTPTGLTLTFTQSGGAPTGELLYCSEYWLEQKAENGWKRVPDILDPDINYGWTDLGVPIPRNGQQTEEVNWSWFYGQLAPGRYRIAKKVLESRSPGDYTQLVYYGEFEVQ